MDNGNAIWGRMRLTGIRVASEQDAAAVAAIYAPYVRDTAISFEDVPPSPDEMRRRITATLATHPFLVFEREGRIVAYAYASQHKERAAYRWSADVTIYASPEVHRRGIGRLLYTELFDLLARQGIHSAFAGVTLPNEKSVGLHEAMGFEPIGIYRETGFKFGAWRDVGWWRRSIGSGLPRHEPIAFRNLIAPSPSS